MHEWGNSGITAVLLALVVAVLFSLGVAQQARARAARYHEIRRLQSEAAEEARRAEEEVEFEYTSMLARPNCCVICLNPTTTRCSRCKAVRYCSTSCQIQHWKQGHKQECRAPDMSNGGVVMVAASNGSGKLSDVYSSRGSSGSHYNALSEGSDFQTFDDPVQIDRIKPTPQSRIDGTLSRPQQILFPYDYFVQFFTWDKLKLPPCGLINCGNSCFANVVLQCLTYTRPLTAYLLEGRHAEECRQSEWCFMCELQHHVDRVRQSQVPFSPIQILSRIRNIGNHLGYGKQEDAHEFMRFAIDSMQSICLDEAGGEKNVDPRSQETTLIHHVFGGHLQSQVKCMQCLHESNRYESMMDLAVEIHGFVETLEDALTQFTSHEWLDGDNKYQCDRCNAYVTARKRLTVHEAPNILTIALKRFQSGKFGKLNKRVTFPEVLNISPYMSGKSDNPPLYRLYAVVVHVDMLNASFFGHYICYVKDIQGTWYKVDDSKVKEVDLEKVMAQRAYMLFYSRSTARHPPDWGDRTFQPYITNRSSFHLNGSIISVDELQSNFYVSSNSTFVEVGKVLPATGGTLGVFGDEENNEEYANEVCQDISVPTCGEGRTAEMCSRTWEREIDSLQRSNNEQCWLDSGCDGSSLSSLTNPPSCSNAVSLDNSLPVSKSSSVCLSEVCSEEETGVIRFGEQSHFSSEVVPMDQGSYEIDKTIEKVTKRRLDPGLTPLPTPRPLDTGLLPAWPAANHGRSSSCSSVLHLPSNQPTYSRSMDCPPSSHHHILESPISGSNSLLPRYSTIKSGSPVVQDPDCILERPEFEDSQEAEMPKSILTRAKRQHLDSDAPKASCQDIAPCLNEQVLSIKQVDLPTQSKAEMDLDGHRLQSQGLVLEDLSSSVIESTSEDICSFGANIENDVTRGSVQTDFSSADLELESPGTEKILMDLPSYFQQPTTALDDLGRSCLELETGGDMQEQQMQSAMAGVLETSVKCMNENHSKSLTGVADICGMVGLPSSSTLLSVNAAVALNVRKMQQRGGMDKAEEDEAENEVSSVEVLPLDGGQSEMISNGSVTIHHSDGLVRGKQTETVPSSGLSVLGITHKRKTPKPLFSPGFLNRGHISSSSFSLQTKVSRAVLRDEGVGNDSACSSNINTVPPCEGTASDISDSNEHGLRCNGISDTHKKKQSKAPICASNLSSIHFDSVSTATSLASSLLESNSSVVGQQREGNGCTDKSNDIPANSHAAEVTRHASSNGVVNGAAYVDLASKIQAVHTDEEHPLPLVQDTLVTLGQTSLSRPGAGKQKQGRNESCACGSQRKWKKCCGKVEAIKQELSTRRVAV